jgi:hypothetical protein
MVHCGTSDGPEIAYALESVKHAKLKGRENHEDLPFSEGFYLKP